MNHEKNRKDRLNRLSKLACCIMLTSLIILSSSIESLAAPNESNLSLGNSKNVISPIFNEDDVYETLDLSTGIIEYHSFSELHDFTKDRNRFQIQAAKMPQIDFSKQSFFNATINAIIGTDDRSKVAFTNIGPYCNTVYIKTTYTDGAVAEATGFVIANSAVATAAHVVSSPNRTVKSVTIIPAKNGSTHPYGSTEAKKITITSNYASSKKEFDDWAVIETKDPIGATTGWLGLRTQTASYNNTYVINTGYPKPSTCSGQAADRFMFMGTGRVKDGASSVLKCDFDATDGNSGGPVFAYYSDTGYTAIGILTAGSAKSTDNSSYPTAFSSAVRISKDMYNLFLSYR